MCVHDHGWILGVLSLILKGQASGLNLRGEYESFKGLAHGGMHLDSITRHMLLV